MIGAGSRVIFEILGLRATGIVETIRRHGLDERVMVVVIDHGERKYYRNLKDVREVSPLEELGLCAE